MAIVNTYPRSAHPDLDELDLFLLPELETSPELSDTEQARQTMESLAVEVQPGVRYYEAADPGYKSSFTRDSLTTMLLCGDRDALRSQVDYSARLIGTKVDPKTGEEPGKAHHQLPSVDMSNGLNTAYNACDTTAELLRGMAVLADLGDPNVLDQYEDVIQAGINYIKRHVNNHGLFIEDPEFSGVNGATGRDRKFGLKVTYWKDSELNREGSREPNYPIVYTVAHFQNAEALEMIGRATNNERLARFGRYMTEAGLQHLWSGNHFVTAIDQDGVIDPPSTDSLYALLHIPPERLPLGCAEMIERYTHQLVTDAGYRSGRPVVPDVDPYHMKVWVHEQALLHAAAERHNLTEAKEITRRIEPYIDPSSNLFPEIINPDTFQPDGNALQLWAIGAYLYFKNPEKSLLIKQAA